MTVTVTEEVAVEESVLRPVTVARAVLERLMLGEPVPVLLAVAMEELLACGVEVLLAVLVTVTVELLEAAEVAVVVALTLVLKLALEEEEVLGEEVVEWEGDCVTAAVRLRLGVLEALCEAKKVRESVVLGVEVGEAEGEMAEAVRVAETQEVGDTMLLTEREGEAALVGVVLEEGHSVADLWGEREGERRALGVPVAHSERLPSCPVKVAQEDWEGVRAVVVEAVRLPPPAPPPRVGVMGLLAERRGEGVMEVETEGLREREGEGLGVRVGKGVAETETETEARTLVLGELERREEPLGTLPVGEPVTVVEGVMPPLRLPCEVRDTEALEEMVRVAERDLGIEAV